MKKSFNIKDVAIVLLVLFLLFQKAIFPEKEVVTETKTTTIDIKKEIEEAVNNRMQLQQPTQQPTIIYQDRVVPVYRDTPIPKGDEDKVKNLNKYTDTTKLDNAKIYSEILTDGTIYQNKVTAEVDVKTITNTIEKKIVKYGSGIYVMPEVRVNQVNFIESAGASIMYIHKGDIGFGVGADYNFQTQQMNYSGKVLIKLF
jgi:hypothetical protein